MVWSVLKQRGSPGAVEVAIGCHSMFVSLNNYHSHRILYYSNPVLQASYLSIWITEDVGKTSTAACLNIRLN